MNSTSPRRRRSSTSPREAVPMQAPVSTSPEETERLRPFRPDEPLGSNGNGNGNGSGTGNGNGSSNGHAGHGSYGAAVRGKTGVLDRPRGVASAEPPGEPEPSHRPTARGKFLFAGDEKLCVKGVT